MKKILTELSKISNEIEVPILTYENVVKQYLHGNPLLANDLRFIGFDVADGDITDIKFYVLEDNSIQHTERSFSVVDRPNRKYREKMYYRNDFTEETIAMDELQKTFDIIGIPEETKKRYISYGNIIRKFTNTSVYPCAGYGIIKSDDDRAIGIKIYYTFFSYKEKYAKFGEVNNISSLMCIQDLLASVHISEEIKKNIYRPFEMLASRLVMSVFALNTALDGNEEYKIYFHLKEETHSERYKNIQIIENQIWKKDATQKSRKVVEAFMNVDNMIIPAEHCISIKNNNLMHKFYYRVKK